LYNFPVLGAQGFWFTARMEIPYRKKTPSSREALWCAVFLLYTWRTMNLGLAVNAVADTLTLKNGQVLEGYFVGGNANGVTFVGQDGCGILACL
jgi:hypothetical protein